MIFPIVIIALFLTLLFFDIRKWRIGRESGWFVIPTLLGIVLFIVLATSYFSAVDVDVIKRGLIAEYKSAIDLYQDKAVLKIDCVVDRSITDLKFEGYQRNIAEMILNVRKIVEDHNSCIIRKQNYCKNPLFGWLIVMPDDQRLIHVIDKH